jgi:hypothetical protein
VADDARFCQSCGTALADEPTTAEAVPPHETTPAPASFDVAMPRYFGITPPMLLFAVAVAALALAIAFAVLSHWFAAITLAFVCLLLLVAFAGVAQRKPSGAFARRSGRTFTRVRDRAGWTAESLALRSAARRRLTSVRRSLFELQLRRESLLRELGAAVYDGDAAATQSATAEIRRIDDEVGELEARMHAIAAETRERMERGRLQVQPTLIEPPQQPNIPEPSPPPDEGTPPQPPQIPEPSPPPDEGTPPQPAPVPEPGPQRDV